MSEIGIIFHWGIYSVPGFMKKPKKDGNGTEWYLQRLLETGRFRPISGFRETQEFHRTKYNDQDYYEFSNDFLYDTGSIEDWIAMCSGWGIQYVILTAKHHDGFCLWPTSTTQRNCRASGPKKDIVLEFKNAARKYNLKFGVYYSWWEFGKSISKSYLNTVVGPQIEELEKYNPDLWWFDGHWEIKTAFSVTFISDILHRIKSSGCEVNDRVPNSKTLNFNELGEFSTFRVYEDRTIPSSTPTVPWESIQTVGNSWGINKYSNQYKSVEDLVEIYRKVKLYGGKLLLNIGPDEHGQLDSSEVEILHNFFQVRREVLLHDLDTSSR